MDASMWAATGVVCAALITAIVAVWNTKRSVAATVQGVWSTAYMELIDRLRLEVKEQCLKNDALEEENEQLRRQNSAYREFIRSRGLLAMWIAGGNE